MKISNFPLLLFAGTIAFLPFLRIASCENTNPGIDQDQIKFYGWNQRGVNQVELQFDNDIQLKEFFNWTGYTFLYVYFHDIKGNGLETWIQENKEILFDIMGTDIHFETSVDYQTFVLNKSEAIRNIEPIANRTAEFLIRLINLFSDRALYFHLIGHGMGAIIAASVSEKLQSYNPFYFTASFTALDPEIIDAQDLYEANLKNSVQIRIPKIKNVASERVYAVHTSTCSHIPVIPACDDSITDTMGKGDFYPNGGGTQPGCLQTDSSCSRKRAVEIFVESNAAVFYDKTSFYALQCSNFDQFQSGTCGRCDSGQCYEMKFYFGRPLMGRFFFYTNSASPYARGIDQTPP